MAKGFLNNDISLTWSTDGLINEYCNPCESIRDGVLVEVPALEELEQFTLDGVEFVALNAGPNFKFTEAVSFVVYCDTQEEVDYFWEKLTADGGEPSQCSWLKDKYGLSWQVQPRLLIQLLGDPDKAKAERVMSAMMDMTKIDIEALKKAAESK